MLVCTCVRVRVCVYMCVRTCRVCVCVCVHDSMECMCNTSQLNITEWLHHSDVILNLVTWGCPLALYLTREDVWVEVLVTVH